MISLSPVRHLVERVRTGQILVVVGQAIHVRVPIVIRGHRVQPARRLVPVRNAVPVRVSRHGGGLAVIKHRTLKPAGIQAFVVRIPIFSLGQILGQRHGSRRLIKERAVATEVGNQPFRPARGYRIVEVQTTPGHHSTIKRRDRIDPVHELILDHLVRGPRPHGVDQSCRAGYVRAGHRRAIEIVIAVVRERAEDVHPWRSQVNCRRTVAAERCQLIVVIAGSNRNDVLQIVAGRIRGITVVVASTVPSRGHKQLSGVTGPRDRVV